MANSTPDSNWIQLPLFPTKFCPKCNNHYPLTRQYWNYTTRDGFRGICTACFRKAGREYQRYLKEKPEHRRRIQLYTKQWKQNNKEKHSEHNKRWIKAHPEQVKANVLKWRNANEERVRQGKRIRQGRRRALEVNAEGSHTIEQVQALYIQQEGKCFHCGMDISVGYHEDHWIPLSKGGSNWIENIRLLCPVCNWSKHDKLPHEWNDRYKEG